MLVGLSAQLYVGGIGTTFDPLIGALVISLLPETIRSLKDYQDLVISGVHHETHVMLDQQDCCATIRDSGRRAWAATTAGSAKSPASWRAGGDLDAFKAKLLLDVDSRVAGVGEGMVEYGLLHLGGDAIGMRAFGPRQAVNEALGSAGLEIAPDLVELLAGVTHHLAGAADVGKFCGEIVQGELAGCYLVLRVHVILPFG